AHRHEPRQQVAQRQRALAAVAPRLGLGGVEALDGFMQALSANEAHGVVGPAIVVHTQAVDGDNARMLQLSRDLPLAHKPRPAVRIVDTALLDLLEGDLALQPPVQRYRHFSQPATRMTSQTLVARHACGREWGAARPSARGGGADTGPDIGVGNLTQLL